MEWSAIESKAQLDGLYKSVCWEDAPRLVMFAGSGRNQPWFPNEVSRSGFSDLNLHLLYEVNAEHGRFLEMVWIGCDTFSSEILNDPRFDRGHVDTLKRIEVADAEGRRTMRCCRIIYRYHSDYPEDGLLALLR